MRLSDGVEWGIHCAALLAFLPPGAALPASRLAEYHGVPAAYLAKHLQALARAGILDAAQGPGGGYRLARPADEISVLDVVEAIDGQEAAFRCDEIRRRGPTASPAREYRIPCVIHHTMLEADAVWRGVLRATTIADLAGRIVEQAAPVVLDKGARWLAQVLPHRDEPARRDDEGTRT